MQSILKSRHPKPDDHNEVTLLCPADMPSKSRKAFLQQMIENMPETVRNRIIAMKNLQLRQLKISEQFYRDVYELERNYYAKADDMLEMRRQIISGEYEPHKQKKYFKEQPDDMIEEIKNHPDFQTLTDSIKGMSPDVTGIPKFWLNVFRNVPIISEWVLKHDEPLLESLMDIRIKYEPDAYIFEFCFCPNDYLLTPVLTKKYYLRHVMEEDDPFSFEGPEIYKCEGCPIPWCMGKNLTEQPTDTKKSKKKKIIPRESFFRFFMPPAAVDLSLADEKTKIALANDFEVGYLLRTQVIPKAVLFYTGDIVDTNDDDVADDDETDTETEEDETKSTLPETIEPQQELPKSMPTKKGFNLTIGTVNALNEKNNDNSNKSKY